MTAPKINIGDVVVHYWRYAHGVTLREVLRTKIVRETPTQWIDDRGDRWRKKDGSAVAAGYGANVRGIMPAAEFDAREVAS